MRKAVGVLVWLCVLGCSTGPDLVVEDEVPDDVERLADEVWDEFVEGVGHVGSCLGPVGLAVDPDLDDRARYEPDRPLVVIRTPATAARLRQSLLHEFAHHLDYSCLEETTVRVDFMEAVGGDVPWFDSTGGADAPAELFADAMSLVLQDDEFVRIRAVPSEGVEYLRRWLVESRRQ